jgi:hypothetical protein
MVILLSVHHLYCARPARRVWENQPHQAKLNGRLVSRRIKALVPRHRKVKFGWQSAAVNPANQIFV